MLARTFLPSWLRRLRDRKARGSGHSRVLQVEQLEERELLSTTALLREGLVLREALPAHRHAAHHRHHPRPALFAPGSGGGWRFDFGGPGTPVAPGYIGVYPEAYSAALGYGWANPAAVRWTDRGGPDPLLRDFNSGASGTFLVDVPNGTYNVTPTLGDLQQARRPEYVYFGGSNYYVVPGTAAGQVVRPTYQVTVTGGQLRMSLYAFSPGTFALDALTVSTVSVNPGPGGPGGGGSTPLAASAGPSENGNEGSAVTFSGAAQGGTAPYAYAWDFGDGTTTKGTASPSHAYGKDGKFTVTLAVTDASGGSSTSTTTANVAEVPPAVSITGAPASGHSPEGTAISLGSTVTDADPAEQAAGFTYAWTVTKNGSPFASGTSSGINFTPDDAGTYVATLNATDNDGGVGSTSTTIAADDVAPTVAITGAPAYAPPGQAINLGSAVSDASTVDAAGGYTYAWSVTKDGAAFTAGSGANFSFTPDTEATYVVSLTATDSDPESATAQQTIFVSSSAAPILLPANVLNGLRQEAAANTPQWQAFKAHLDGNLNQVIQGGYGGSELSWIADYALGYQVYMNSDPATASKYADKAIAVMKIGLYDSQLGSEQPYQFLALGNGATTTFALPNANLIPSSLEVMVNNVTTTAVVRGGTINGTDYVADPVKFLTVSNTANGPANYTQGTDWVQDPQLTPGLIQWLPGGKQPAAGATYYVTWTAPFGLSDTPYALNGSQITLKAPLAVNQALYVKYVYGTHSADGSTLAYQQTSNGNGGFNSAYFSQGYTARYLGKYLAIGLDWLDGYVGLSTAFKSTVETRLVQWADWNSANCLHATDPESNYGAGNYVSLVITALALQHRDAVNGPRLLAEALNYRQNFLLPELQNTTTSLDGGFWAEGWNYGELGAINVLLPGLALEEKGLIPSAAAERQWASQATLSLIGSQPTPASVTDSGDWFAFPSPLPGKDLFDVLGYAADSTTAQSYDNYVLQNYPGAQNNNFLDVLFRNPSATASYWSTQPLANYAPGTELLTTQSNWNQAGSPTTWESVQFGNLLAAGHQTAAPGTMEIWHNGDPLLVNGNAPGQFQNPGDAKSTHSNTVIVDDNGEGAQTYRYQMGDWYGNPGVVVNAEENTAAYSYIYGNYAAAYSTPRAPGAGGSVSELTRQVMYLRPGYTVVYDRVTTIKDYYAKQLRWHFLNAPTVAGNSFVETNGGSKLFGQTFSTLPLTTTAAPVTVASATVQELITQNSTNSASVRYVTAFEATGAATAAMDATTHILSTDSRLEGVQIGSSVALFGRNGDLDLTAPVTYQVTGNGGFLQQYVANLKSGQSYQVSVNGAVVATVTASSAGMISFTTSGAGTQTVQIGTAG